MKVHATIITIVRSNIGRLLDILLYYCQLYIHIVLATSTTKKGGCFLLLSMSEVPHSNKDEDYKFHYTCDVRYVVIWEWMRVVIQNLNFMSLIKHIVSKECTNEVIRGVHGHDNVQLHWNQ